MEFLKFWDVCWKGPEKRNKLDLHVVATTAKHPDSRVVKFHATAGCNVHDVHAQHLILGDIYFRQPYQCQL